MKTLFRILICFFLFSILFIRTNQNTSCSDSYDVIKAKMEVFSVVLQVMEEYKQKNNIKQKDFLEINRCGDTIKTKWHIIEEDNVERFIKITFFGNRYYIEVWDKEIKKTGKMGSKSISRYPEIKIDYEIFKKLNNLYQDNIEKDKQ